MPLNILKLEFETQYWKIRSAFVMHTQLQLCHLPRDLIDDY